MDSSSLIKLSGAELLVQCLIANGVDTVFGIPGESFLAHLESMRGHQDKIQFVVNRHEGGAAFMADAYSKVTGKPGVLFVSRFPGATNASIGIGVAGEDSSPLVLFIGQVDQAVMGRQSFQEIDYSHFFGDMTKAVMQITDAGRIPEIVAAAFQLATSGRQGPVVVVLPHDVQLHEVTLTSSSSSSSSLVRGYQPAASSPSSSAITALCAMLRASERPIMIVGGSGWSSPAQSKMIDFAANNHIAVVTASRRNDLFPNDHLNYAGVATVGINPRLADRIKNSDLIIAYGCRLDEMTTARYTLLTVPTPSQKVIHIYPGLADLGRVYQADLAINSGVAEMGTALFGFNNLYDSNKLEARKAWVDSAHQDYLSFLQYDGSDLELDLSKVVKTMQAMLPADAIIANGAGNNAQWLDRFYRYRSLHTKLTSVCGSMGYGVPAAIAAKLVRPETAVVSWNGDGCFQMNMNELILAASRRLKVIFIIVENGVYGTIRQHQEKAYPCHKFGTDIDNPDFLLLAQAYKCLGQRISRTEEFAAAFQAALDYDGPSILSLRVSPDLLSPSERISSLCTVAQNVSETAFESAIESAVE